MRHHGLFRYDLFRDDVLAYLERHRLSLAAFCRRHGIDRTTFYRPMRLQHVCLFARLCELDLNKYIKEGGG